MSLIHDTSTAIQALRQLDSFGLAAMICDSSGVIQLMNNACAALLGEEPRKLEGINIKETPALEPIVEFLVREKPQITPVQVLLYDHLHCLMRMQQIGRVGYIFTFEDVTALKDREEQQSTALDSVAHDLKAPLSATKGFADLVRSSGELNDKQKQFMDRIFTAIDHMEGLVRDLLDIAWLDSDRPMTLESVSLLSILTRSIETLHSHADKRNITIETQCDEGLAAIYGDSRRLERVFINIVSNAIKYTPVGGNVSITLSSDGKFQIVEVMDNGIGIPDAYQPHIFKRFYRVPRHDNEKMEGTGLGLSIVKTVVERHQGDVSVLSEVDKGSVFTVRLPEKQMEDNG